MNFQARVAAVCAVHLLAGRQLQWLKELASDIPVELWCETNGPGDDLRLLLANQEMLEAQIKKGLRTGPDLWTALESLAQGVSQNVIAYGVLVVDGDASQTIRSGLARGLRRLGEGRTDLLGELAIELKARLEVIGVAVEPVCRRLRIVTLHCADHDGASEHVARSDLARLCANEQDAIGAWQTIQLSSHSLIERQGRWTCDALTQMLVAAGTPLHTVPERSVTGVGAGLVWPHLDGVSTHRGHIQAFRQHYLFSAQHVAQPFGGREAECRRLDEWLCNENGPSRFLISAPTARGKSALVVQWTEGLDSDAIWATVFVPISFRFNTDRPAVFYAMLAAQLACLLGTTIGPPLTDQATHYQGACVDLLNLAAKTSRRVLIVIDGLDETQSAGFNPTVLLPTLPPTIKILVTAREQAGDRSNGGWLRRLGWESKGSAEIAELSILDRTAIGPILISVDIPSELVDDALCQRLMQLTEGEPLLMALYAEDLRDIVREGGTITAGILADLSPGFAAYFSRAFDMLGLAGDTDNLEVIDTTLGVLALALGPLETQHLTDLVCQIAGVARPMSSTRFVKPLMRFIAGDGHADHGYVLNHPKLAEYLREQRFDRIARQRVEEGFIAWGRAIGKALCANSNADAPSYAVRNHVRHLKQANAMTLDDVELLLTDGWRRAWLYMDKEYVVYADSLLEASAAMGACLSYRPQESRALRLRWKLALFASSIRSHGVSVPPELIAMSLEEQMITLPQALNIVALHFQENQIGYLLALCPYLPSEDREQLLRTIHRTQEPENRYRQLTQLIPHLDSPSQEESIGVVVSWLATEAGTRYRAGFIATIASTLHDQQLDQLLRTYIANSKAEEDLFSAIHSLAPVVHLLRTQGNMELTEMLSGACLAWIDTIPDVISAAEALTALAPALSTEGLIPRAVKLQLAVQAEQAFSVPTEKYVDISVKFRLDRISAANAALHVILLDQLPAAIYTTHLMAMLSPLFVSQYEAVSILISILPVVRTEARQELVAKIERLALGLQTPNNRTHKLLQLAKFAAPPLRKSIIEQAFAHARQIEDAHAVGLTLIQLFSAIEVHQRTQELDMLFADIGKVRYTLEMGELLLRLSCIPPANIELAESALETILQTEDIGSIAAMLLREISNFPRHMHERIFRASLERIRMRTYRNSSFHIGMAARYATDLWTVEDLDFARSQLATVQPELHAQLLFDLVPVAHRLGANDLIAEALAAVPNAEGDMYHPIHAMSRLPHGYVDSGLFSQTWSRALALSPTNLGLLIDTMGFLPLEQQAAAWSVLVECATARTDARALAKLSSLSKNKDERNQLFNAALQACESYRPDFRLPALADILPMCATEEESWRVLDLLTARPVASREVVLEALQIAAIEMGKVTGNLLPLELMIDVRQSVAWWP